ncbi:hypothetical protein M3Y98_00086200 [Aphelenchoides besseyi]|nr:hypothetical protein M3Y98_00086200 [Aphelenchoides besseyi]
MDNKVHYFGIGVITPFRAQSEILANDTTSHLADERRINFAFTRAKQTYSRWSQIVISLQRFFWPKSYLEFQPNEHILNGTRKQPPFSICDIKSCLPSIVAETNFDMRNIDFEMPVQRLIVFNFILSTILLSLVILLLLTKSLQMTVYRWYLFNTVIWCYLFYLLVFLIRPTFLFPSKCVIFLPLIEFTLTATTFLFYFTYHLVSGLPLPTSRKNTRIVFENRVSTFVEENKLVYVVYLFTYIFVYLSVLLPILWGQLN